MYVWDLVKLFGEHLTLAGLLVCVGLYGVVAVLVCGAALFFVLARMKVSDPLCVMWDFRGKSALFSLFVLLFLLPYLPFVFTPEQAEQLPQQRYERFRAQLCRELDRASQDGNYPFLLYENGQGIVLLKQAGNRYEDLVRTLAKKQLPDLELQAWSPPSGSFEYHPRLVRAITDGNRVVIMKALADKGQRELFIYRVVIGLTGLPFFSVALPRLPRRPLPHAQPSGGHADLKQPPFFKVRYIYS